MPFDRLGPYRVERRLGRGGMGTVYAAVDEQSGQWAALKVLAAHLAAEEGFRQRFSAEIESLRKLMHPNIVRLYGFGEQDGCLYYAMELVEGASLESELQAGRRFDWREVVDIGRQVCRALRHAHDHGIIHRDIKPANLLWTADGTVKLSDFGIARLFGQKLTGVGGVIGTAEYMSPEQAEGRPATHHCDLYSLGCVLYALLAGRPPFQAATVPAVLHQQRYVPPESVSRFAPHTPRSVEAVLQRLLAKSPDERFPNASVLARELEATLHDAASDGVSALPPTPPVNPRSSAPDAIPPVADRDAGPATTHGTLAVSEAVAGEVAHEAYDPSGSAPPSSEPAPRPNRFIVVSPSDAAARSGQRGVLQSFLSPQTLMLVVALAAIVALAAYLLSEPSTEVYWRRIEKAAAADSAGDKLLTVESDIAHLLAKLPADDPRRARLQEYQESLEMLRLEKKLRRVAADRGGREPLSAIERQWVHAAQLADADPAVAVRRFQTLVDLYDSPGESVEKRRVVALAKRQLEQLRPLAQQRIDELQTALHERLARADELSAADPPSARRIREAIVREFAQESWAADAVRRAKSALAGAKSR